MALMAAQSVSTVLTPSFTAPTTSDTIDARTSDNLWLHVKVGGTSTTITVTPGGTQDYSGANKSGLQQATITNADRIFKIPRSIGDPVTGIVTVTYNQVTGVTAGLFQM